MKAEEKKRSILLRRKGESIKEIARLLGVSKSSVSMWVRNIKLTNQQKEKLSKKGHSIKVVEKRRESRLKNEKEKRRLIMSEAGKDFEKLSEYELKMIGVMLYWAEGGKTRSGSVRLSNSDPGMIKIMMKFFRKICDVKEEKFRGHIHTHSHININRAETYWSKTSHIPKKQFFKTYAKPSSSSKGKKDSLPYGTFDIYVCDTKLFLKIMGWVDKIKKLTLS